MAMVVVMLIRLVMWLSVRGLVAWGRMGRCF